MRYCQSSMYKLSTPKNILIFYLIPDLSIFKSIYDMSSNRITIKDINEIPCILKFYKFIKIPLKCKIIESVRNIILCMSLYEMHF